MANTILKTLIMTAQISVLASIILIPHAQATTGADDDFYEGKADGWFWYEDPPTEPEVVEKEPEVIPPSPTAQKSEEPKPLSAEWLKVNLEKFRNVAIDDPNNENIATYLYLQRLTMDKASTFSRQVKFVTQADPNLDEGSRNPVAPYARREVNKNATKMEDKIIAEMGAKGGLWFFYKSDCPYCVQIAPHLKTIERLYGLKVYAISMDGQELPGGLYPDYVQDSGQSESLDVQMTPSVFLASPPEGVTPVTFGVVALEELKSRIVTAAARTGWVDMNDYSLANAVLDDPTPPTPDEAALKENLSAAELLKELREIYK